MASVVAWPPQVSGAGTTRAGWPGSNGSTMLTNGVMAAVVAVPVAAGLDAAGPGLPGPDEHPASAPASPAPHIISTATRASGRLAAPSHIANSISPSSQHRISGTLSDAGEPPPVAAGT